MGCAKPKSDKYKENILPPNSTQANNNPTQEKISTLAMENKKIDSAQPSKDNAHNGSIIAEQTNVIAATKNTPSPTTILLQNNSKISSQKPPMHNTDLSSAFPKRIQTPAYPLSKKYKPANQRPSTPTNLNKPKQASAKHSLSPKVATNSKFIKKEAKKKAAKKMTKEAKASAAPKEGEPANKKPGMTYNSEMEKIIMDCMMTHDTTVTWNDVIGMDSVKEKLNETLILPYLRPDLFTDLRSPIKGILLYGPPGNGKTMIARAVVSQCKDINFFNISAGTITTKWFGESEKLIQALFSIATQKQPSVIFIDEIDSILGKRSGSENDAVRRLKTEFLIQFDGVTSGSADKVVLIGATNRPFDLDEAVLRRFTCRVYIELPIAEARMSMVMQLISKLSNEMKNDDLSVLHKKTEGFSFADLAALCKEASMEPLRELSNTEILSVGKDRIRPIKLQDFLKALKRISPSVSPQSLKEFECWTKQNQV